MEWRAMTKSDLPAVAGLAALVHPNYPERVAVFAERLALYPAGCKVLQRKRAIDGYLVSHPWRSADPPKLDALLGALPSAPDTYYLHDISVLPTARRSGIAASAVAALVEHARAAGFASMSLVAVNDSVDFWMRLGFQVVETPELAHRLATYDGEARFMTKAL